MGLTIGEPAPWVVTRSPSNPNYNLSAAAGRFVLMAFLPADPAARNLAVLQVNLNRALFDDDRLCAFFVVRDPQGIAEARDLMPGLRWFLDSDSAVFRAFRVLDAEGTETPQWLLLDPTLRVMHVAPLDQPAPLFAHIAALPAAPEEHAATPLHAPVLIVPRIFEPELCRRLIEVYDQSGGAVSGVMREVDGMTVPVVDNFKSRRDANIDDEGLRQELLMRIRRRLLPEVTKAFQFKATRLERHIVACYEAADGGYFKPHRDNTTKGTAHRKFAVSINLNAEEYEGGDLRFPEFGRRTYRPPTGGAVVFSCSLLHEATRVARGRRYAYLPFLYDEEGATIREANMNYVTPAQHAPA